MHVCMYVCVYLAAVQHICTTTTVNHGCFVEKEEHRCTMTLVTRVVILDGV